MARKRKLDYRQVHGINGIRTYRDPLGILIQRRVIPVSQVEFKEKQPVQLELRAKRYAERMKAGERFPPIHVFGPRFPGDTFQVYDGHARVTAAKLLGHKVIDAEITLVNRKGRPRKQ